MQPFTDRNRRPARGGYLIPAIAFALLVVGAAVALVLDRLWIDAAKLELRTAAEAAALAGAGRLVNDDRLRETFDAAAAAQGVRETAAEAAARNFAVGEPVVLDPAPGGDVRLGRIVPDDLGRDVFLETEDWPTSVLIFAARTRSRSNPVALFFRELTGQTAADVVSQAEATVDGRTIGVQSIPGATAPAVPLAILADDPLGERADTWRSAIEARSGADRYTYDPASGTVLEEPDGIPEITLRSAPAIEGDSSSSPPNVALVDVGTQLSESLLAEQIRRGFSEDDLALFGGELHFGFGPVTLESSTTFSAAARDALQSIVGEPRICLLYESSEEADAWAAGTVSAVRLAAGRVMTVSSGEGDSVEIVFQPALVATRTALLQESLAPGPFVSPHVYVYKLHLTQ